MESLNPRWEELAVDYALSKQDLSLTLEMTMGVLEMTMGVLGMTMGALEITKRVLTGLASLLGRCGLATLRIAAMFVFL